MTTSSTDRSGPTSTSSMNRAATPNWEREGEVTPSESSTHDPVAAAQLVKSDSVAPAQIESVDALQDKLMIAKSSEGASPSRRWRLSGWHWLAVVVPLIAAIGGVVWVALAVGIGTALAGMVLLAVMVGAAVPVWGAGLFRGTEEREAKVEAKAELGAGEDQ